MPTTQPPNENVESVIEEFDKKFSEGCFGFSVAEEHLLEVKSFLRTHLLASYAEGRASMKADIEQVVPEDEKIPKTECITAEKHLFGFCLECERIKVRNVFRSELLNNIKGIL